MVVKKEMVILFVLVIIAMVPGADAIYTSINWEYVESTGGPYLSYRCSFDGGDSTGINDQTGRIYSGGTYVCDRTLICDGTTNEISLCGGMVDGTSYHLEWWQRPTSTMVWAQVGGDSGSFTYDDVDPDTDITVSTAWSANDVSFTLSRTDIRSGIAGTYYYIDTDTDCPSAGGSYTSGTSGTVTGTSSAVTLRYVCYYSVDTAGNVETPEVSGQIKIDKQGPSLSMSATTDGNPYTLQSYSGDLPNTQWGSDDNIGVSFSGSDGSGSGSPYTYKYCYDTTNTCDASSGTTGSSVTISSEGLYYIRAIAQDEVGNWGSTYSKRLLVDKTAPTVCQITAPNNGDELRDEVEFASSYLNIDTYGVHNISYYYGTYGQKTNVVTSTTYGSVYSAAQKPFTGDYNTTSLPNGPMTLFAYCYDHAGNELLSTNMIPVVVDNEMPATTLDAIPNILNYSDIRVNGSASDVYTTIDNIQFQLDYSLEDSWDDCVEQDGTFNEAAEEFYYELVSLAEGNHTVYSRSADSAGNVETSLASDTFCVDTIFPVPNTTGPYAEIENTTITLNASNTIEANTCGDTTYEWDLDNDGNYDDATGITTSFNKDDNGFHVIGLRVTDAAGNMNITNTTVNYSNAAPVLDAFSITPLVLDENENITVSFTMSDVGENDTHNLSIDWGDNNTFFNSSISVGAMVVGHKYLDNGVYNVSFVIYDDDGANVSNTTEITVNNLDPEFVNLNVTTYVMDENETITLVVNFTDNSTVDTHNTTINFGDNSSYFNASITNGQFTTSHRYLDNGVYNISYLIVDDDNGNVTATRLVVVHNVLPVFVGLNSTYTINENDTISFEINFSDNGSLDTHSVFMDFGDGYNYTNSSIFDEQFLTSHQYLDNGIYNITLNMTDKDGNSTVGTSIVTVNNVLPVFHFTFNEIVNETSNVSVVLNYSDVGSLDTHNVTIDWDDTNSSFSGNISFGDVIQHAYVNNGTYNISVNLTDDDGGSVVTVLSLEVINVPPQFSISDRNVQEGISFFVTTPFVDVLNDSHSYYVDWGDGTNSTNGSIYIENFTISHSYGTDGYYNVNINLTDSDGNYTADVFVVHAYAVSVSPSSSGSSRSFSGGVANDVGYLDIDLGEEGSGEGIGGSDEYTGSRYRFDVDEDEVKITVVTRNSTTLTFRVEGNISSVSKTYVIGVGETLEIDLDDSVNEILKVEAMSYGPYSTKLRMYKETVEEEVQEMSDIKEVVSEIPEDDYVSPVEVKEDVKEPVITPVVEVVEEEDGFFIRIWKWILGIFG